MRIQQLKTSSDGLADSTPPKSPAPASGSSAAAASAANPPSSPAAPARGSGGVATGAVGRQNLEQRNPEQQSPEQQTPEHQVLERQAVEIALLKARIQHLELVVETARSLMGSNQERLLRRLHEVPREIVGLSAQLHRIDPQASW